MAHISPHEQVGSVRVYPLHHAAQRLSKLKLGPDPQNFHRRTSYQQCATACDQLKGW